MTQQTIDEYVAKCLEIDRTLKWEDVAKYSEQLAVAQLAYTQQHSVVVSIAKVKNYLDSQESISPEQRLFDVRQWYFSLVDWRTVARSNKAAAVNILKNQLHVSTQAKTIVDTYVKIQNAKQFLKGLQWQEIALYDKGEAVENVMQIHFIERHEAQNIVTGHLNKLGLGANKCP